MYTGEVNKYLFKSTVFKPNTAIRPQSDATPAQVHSHISHKYESMENPRRDKKAGHKNTRTVKV